MTLQHSRLWTRSAFFALFVLAPPLDLFRFDLNLGYLIVFGHTWTLGLDLFLAGEVDAAQAAMHMLLRGLVPIMLLVGTGIWISWRYGRLYCGWLCPHFSVVEMLNGLMRRASGKPTLWDARPLPAERVDGTPQTVNRHYWWGLMIAIPALAFLWAVSLLSYLLPPWDIYHHLAHFTLPRGQGLFLAAATLFFSLEFLLARHLFCRFGCAVGLFQSLVWMANKRALVVGFARERVDECVSCHHACDNACPMRLKPRAIKRSILACTQCAQCIEACEQVQGRQGRQSLLYWVADEQALDVSDRELGHKPKIGSGDRA